VTGFRRIAIDVAAFNDVAVHGRTTPRTMPELKEDLLTMAWAIGQKIDWQELHREYSEQFDSELHDPDTLNWRDQRKARLARTSKPRETDSRRRRRA